jgi:hypothetical protein
MLGGVAAHRDNRRRRDRHLARAGNDFFSDLNLDDRQPIAIPRDADGCSIQPVCRQPLHSRLLSKLAGVVVILSIELIQRPQVRFIFVIDYRRVPDVLLHWRRFVVAGPWGLVNATLQPFNGKHHAQSDRHFLGR